MAPRRTGTLEPAWTDKEGRKRFTAKIRLGDGSRHRQHVPLEKCRDKDAAQGWAQWLQEQEDINGSILAAKVATRVGDATTPKPTEPGVETCDEWFGRFFTHRKSLGLSSVEDDRYRWKIWISPVIGPKPMATLTKGDVEDVRDAIDAAVLAHKRQGRGRGRLAPKTGMNVWSVLTKSMAEACNSKNRKLRVREVNPCSGVQPPETGDSKRKPFVYPAEFLALMACEAVPLAWREVHAVACYTYLRPGELRALRWSDIDLEHGIISVSKAWDGRSKSVKTPKTRNGVREFPIATPLLPLLERMKEGRQDGDLVVPKMLTINEDLLADLLRKHLKLAGVKRPRLFEETATTLAVNFRSWRDTGITWLALEGLGVEKMMRRAGHDGVATTMGYVKLAEDVHGVVGMPFPALPESLVGEGDRSKHRSERSPVNVHPSVITSVSGCEGRELNEIPADANEAQKQGDRSIQSRARRSETGRPSEAHVGGPAGPEIDDAEPDRAAILERAIARLTGALATASDAKVEELVGERRMMREELRAIREASSQNVVHLASRRS